MDKQELIDALVVHGKAIETKQADLQKAMEAKITESVEVLKTQLTEMEETRKVMQKQLDDQNIALQKNAKTAEERKSWADDIKAGLTKEIESLVKLKGLSNTRDQLALQVKTFLSTNNASITTGSQLPAFQLEPGIEKAPDRAPFMLDIVSRGASNSLTVYWVRRKTRTDNTERVLEGAEPAAETVIGYETVSATMQNVSSYLKVSNNSLDDIDWLLGEIQTELVTLMMLKIDAAILTGTVATEGFDGILTVATAFSAAGDTLPAGTAPNKWDALTFAITQVVNANFRPNYIVLNPSDVRDMKLTRDGAGAYLLPPQFANLNPAVDGVRIIANTGMTKGSYLVGDFTKAKFWTRKNMELRVWEQNEDDATHQLKTVTLYARGTLVVKTADRLAFVTDTFTDTLAEITNPGA